MKSCIKCGKDFSAITGYIHHLGRDDLIGFLRAICYSPEAAECIVKVAEDMGKYTTLGFFILHDDGEFHFIDQRY